jgi:hypothetical protein
LNEFVDVRQGSRKAFRSGHENSGTGSQKFESHGVIRESVGDRMGQAARKRELQMRPEPAKNTRCKSTPSLTTPWFSGQGPWLSRNAYPAAERLWTLVQPSK